MLFETLGFVLEREQARFVPFLSEPGSSGQITGCSISLDQFGLRLFIAISFAVLPCSMLITAFLICSLLLCSDLCVMAFG